MAGSAAEERIRLKAEAALRAAYPDARIVHELMLRQGGCRIDLAAVTESRLIVVEIKSERDVLTRLERQIEEAREVADGVAVCVAERHLDAARRVISLGYIDVAAEDAIGPNLLMNQRRVLESTCNAPARLGMLWASELRRVAGTSPRTARSYSFRAASDGLTGAEVRQRVCAALRARPFPRADPPVLGELFPEISTGSFG